MSWGFNDITLYYYPEGDAAKEFTLMQNDISSAYIKFLNGYKPTGTTRISVELGEEDDVRFYTGSILTVQAAFNATAFWLLDDLSKRTMILDTINRVACLCAVKYNWKKEIFESAYSKTKTLLNSLGNG
jgi:hypothetical protein